MGKGLSFIYCFLSNIKQASCRKLGGWVNLAVVALLNGVGTRCSYRRIGAFTS
jgi:hypothetical protein